MINLLPEHYRKRQIIISRIYGLILVYVIVVTVLIIATVALTTWNQIQASEIENLTTEQKQLANKNKARTDLIEFVGAINSRIKVVETNIDSSIDWAQLLTSFAQIIPVDVTLTQFNANLLDTGELKISLNAKTPNQRSVFLFRKKLMLESRVSGVKLTQFNKGDDETTFSLELNYNNSSAQSNDAKQTSPIQ